MRFWMQIIAMFIVLGHIASANAAMLMVDAKGLVISKNVLWNACTHGDVITVAMVRANPDVYVHRQRRIRKFIPLTCRDYHRGDLSTWKHPDFMDLEVILDKKGRLIDAPVGFSIEKVVTKGNP